MRTILRKQLRKRLTILCGLKSIYRKRYEKSYLNPIWYLGSFGLAVFMQLQGKKNPGLLAETERQVQTHLEKH